MLQKTYLKKPLTLLILALLAGAFPLQADEPDNSASGIGEHAYIIGTQNLIQVKIFGEGGLQQIFRVDELGLITHPLVGRTKISGLSVAAAERHMENKLRDGYILNPQVTIFVLEHSRFSVLGEIRRPGTYEILGNVSVIEAISMAGGFTPVADQRNVKILRRDADSNEEQKITVDAGKILDRGNRDRDVYIQANDVLVVSKSFF